MQGLGQSIFKEGFEIGLKKASAQGIEQEIIGSVQILRKLGCPKEQIIGKIMKQYDLNRDTAETYLA